MTMLDRMRRHKGWLKWSLALVVLAFIVFYIPSFLSDPNVVGVGALPGEVIAEVEGREVTAGQFLQLYNSEIQAYRTAYGGSLSDEILHQLGIDQQILRQMIDEQAALTEAERQGITVSDEELRQQIFAIPGLQEDRALRRQRALRADSAEPAAADDNGDFRGEPAAQPDDRQAARRAHRLDDGLGCRGRT